MDEKIDNLEEETTEEEVEEEADLSEDEEETEDPADEEETEEEEDVPDKFKGKTVDEVIESYKELEKTLGKRGESIRKGKEKMHAGDPKGDDEAIDELTKELEDVDFDKMTPQDFAKLMIQKTDKLATKRAREIYSQATEVREAAKTEIEEAKEEYPMLGDNENYRDLVLKVIEAGANKGDQVTLKDACKQVDGLLNEKKQEVKEEKTKKKRSRTAVEQQEPSSSEKDDEAEKVRKGIQGGGSKESPFGGLGL
jgi:hypothetical protein